MIDPKKFEAIDPLALIFPPSIYAKIIVESKFPHVPELDVVRKAVSGMTQVEKDAIRVRTRAMMDAVKVAEEAIG